ncbi:MAG: MoaD/ThiS family protein [Actinomycetota bacterium]
MSVEVRMPAVLRRHVGGERSVRATPGSLREVLSDLAGRYPGVGEQILGDEGELHRFVNVYLNDEDVRYLEAGLDAEVTEGDVVSILPAVAGGGGRTRPGTS